MTKTLTNGITVSKLNIKVTGILRRDRKWKDDVQKVLDDFVLGYETALSQNAQPVDRLLKGLRKTDETLIKEWFKRVTNGMLIKNNKGNYTVKTDLEGSAKKPLTHNEKFETLSWYALAEKSETTINDSFATDEKAIKAFESFFNKVVKSNFDKQKIRNIKDKIDELFTTLD